ncbi:NRDE family protein [Labilibaculum manganireducens]|uniref:NRDE family protein n=1 Tax=Labilibaculum manganireducens TaxID=1940525 RepID=UPI0029F53413|nr:NRDE family protein [Labilibaculum manganireducens]
MCTLTYIPIGSDDFFFTTNRDESPLREAEFPNEYHIGESFALYPKDKMAKGTWIMCHENDFSLCLLNGAFEKHKHEPPYKKSRGVMVLEFSEFASTIDFIRDYHFGGMEPFTLLVLRYKYTRNLEEIRWDGETFHYRKLDPSKPYIWSSSTLYNKDAREMRQHWFDNWFRQCNNFSGKETIKFHKTTGRDDAFNGLVMNRKEKVKTLSITQIKRKNRMVSMYHDDLLKEESRDICLTKKSLK